MTEIAKILHKEVQRQGVISFADFMRLALYCPKYGYYEHDARRIGRSGDYVTSVSTTSLFGDLLAFQFAEWLQELPEGPRQIVEAGAHDGTLAADILAWVSQNRSSLFSSLDYWIIEPSPRRRAWQAEKLEKFADRVRWFDSLASLAELRSSSPDSAIQRFNHSTPARIHGIIFSNELLDAFPVHRWGWDATGRTWFEWGVTHQNPASLSTSNPVDGNHFAWKKMPIETKIVATELEQAGLALSAEALAILPDGFIVEVCPEARAWWRQGALALKKGRLLTIDYGLEAERFLMPERSSGTLRTFSRHRVATDLLAHPGEQDLTAHVNFTQIRRVGEEAGLRTEHFYSQERFLTRIAAKAWKKDSGVDKWSSGRVRQFQSLTHPEHLGRPFSVLVQGR